MGKWTGSVYAQKGNNGVSRHLPNVQHTHWNHCAKSRTNEGQE